MSKPTRNQALSDLSLEVFRVTSRLNNLADRLSRRAGLSSARWQTLAALAEAGDGLPVVEIARRMGLQRQSVQRTADALCDLGYIVYEPNPRHRRAKLAVLTERGETALQTLHALREDWANEFKQDLALADLQHATATLRQLRTQLDAETGVD